MYLWFASTMVSNDPHLLICTALGNLLLYGIKLICVSIKIIWKWLCVISKCKALKELQLLFGLLDCSLWRNPGILFEDSQVSLERLMGRGTEDTYPQPASTDHPCEWATLGLGPLAPVRPSDDIGPANICCNLMREPRQELPN